MEGETPAWTYRSLRPWRPPRIKNSYEQRLVYTTGLKMYSRLTVQHQLRFRSDDGLINCIILTNSRLLCADNECIIQRLLDDSVTRIQRLNDVVMVTLGR